MVIRRAVVLADARLAAFVEETFFVPVAVPAGLAFLVVVVLDDLEVVVFLALVWRARTVFFSDDSPVDRFTTGLFFAPAAELAVRFTLEPVRAGRDFGLLTFLATLSIRA